MTNFFVKHGDLLPPLRARVRNAQLDPLDLTNVTGVTFKAKLGSATTIELEGAVSGDPLLGIVQYDWQNGDFTAVVAGEYLLEIQLTYSDGKTLTVPTIGAAKLYVSAGL